MSNNRKNNLRKKEKRNESYSFNQSKRLLGFTVFIVILFIAVILRIWWLQFIKGPSLKEAATKQQTTSRIISPNRGAIYDSTGKPLAISAKVDTVTINPQKFIDEDSEEKTAQMQEKVAKAFSEIFELDYEEVYKKVTSSNSVQTIAKKVEEDKAWETSLLRRILIIILTYIVAILYLKVADTTNPYFGAVVPCAGFFLSTTSLKFIKKIWSKKHK